MLCPSSCKIVFSHLSEVPFCLWILCPLVTFHCLSQLNEMDKSRVLSWVLTHSGWLRNSFFLKYLDHFIISCLNWGDPAFTLGFIPNYLSDFEQIILSLSLSPFFLSVMTSGWWGKLSGFLLFEKDVGSFSGGCMELSLWVTCLGYGTLPRFFVFRGPWWFHFSLLAVGILLSWTTLPLWMYRGSCSQSGIYVSHMYARCTNVSVLPDGFAQNECTHIARVWVKKQDVLSPRCPGHAPF